ncbi:MAG TPA: DUF1257 domain-containing protein [Tepidisphaeraceae bacterium]|nr:DUF1257 domain-containing protein [Tepidisphaeraceae bacterium]
MSCVLVAAPVIIANWPIITAAVTAAVASMGFNVVSAASAEARTGTHASEKNSVNIDIDESEILQNAVAGEEIVVEKANVRAVFRRDARGRLTVCVDGEGMSKAALRQLGQELVDRVTQQYVYHRVVTELKDRKMAIVDEEVTKDRTVKIRVRNL